MAADIRRFLIVSILFGSTLITNGQSYLDQTIEVDYIDQELSEVLQDIENKANLSFAYSSKKIEVGQRVTYTAESVTVRALLSDILEPLMIDFSIVEKQVVLVASKEPKPLLTEEKRQFIYSGYLRDAESLESLIGATIYIDSLKTGTISNAYGFFSLSLEEGAYDITLSYAGYKQVQRSVKLDRDIREELVMDIDTEWLQEVVIRADPVTDFIEKTKMGKSDLPPQKVEQVPALMGETDIIKSLQLVPGVSMFGDGSTYYFVRGGEKDHNMMMIDEAPIYNPTHLLGIFSTFIPEAAKSITLYKGDVPIQYGGRLASLLDVKTKDGSLTRFGMQGSIGLLSTKLTLEAPIVKDKASFFVSGRRSHIRPWIRIDNQNVEDIYFYDISAKVNFKTGAYDRFYISFYQGQDLYDEGNNGINWMNRAGTVRWNHIFNEKLFLNTTFYASKYDYFLVFREDIRVEWNSHIENASLKGDFTYFMNPNFTLDFGVGYSGYNFNPGNVLFSDTLQTNLPVTSLRNAEEFLIYAGVEHRIGRDLTLKYGSRMSSWSNTGEAFEYDFGEFGFPTDTTFYAKGETYNTYSRFEPRFSATYQIDSSSMVSGGYNYSVQNIHLISNSISPFTSLDVWLPSGPNIKPQGSHQVFLGYRGNFYKPGISLGVTGYYKFMTNQIDYVEHANTLLNPFVESELRFGEATARGIEFEFARTAGKFKPAIAYTISKVERTFKDLNGGVPYRARQDRPHVFNINLGWQATPRIHLSANWAYATGSAYSAPTSFIYLEGYQLPIYNQKNNARLPDYHRADLSAVFVLNKSNQRFQHHISMNLYNLYGRKNPVFINYNKVETNGNIVVPVDQLNYQARVPTQTYLFTFLPSVSYNFKL